MANTSQDDRNRDTRPFLMRYLSPLETPPGVIAYDPIRDLNVRAGTTTPAVQDGLDVKTLGAVAED